MTAVWWYGYWLYIDNNFIIFIFTLFTRDYKVLISFQQFMIFHSTKTFHSRIQCTLYIQVYNYILHGKREPDELKIETSKMK